MSKLIFNAPFNSLSFGNVSYNIARELYRKKIDTCILSQGFDISAYDPEPDFKAWLEDANKNAIKRFNKSTPALKLWHVNGSEFSASNKRQVLFTFHETDTATEEEVSIVNQQDYTFFSSSFSKDVFETSGAQNVGSVGLGFDEDILKCEPARKMSKSITHWILIGKWEMRKNTATIIKTWLKKYAKNPRHTLTLVVFNPFLHRQNPHAHEQYFNTLFGGKPKPFNVQIFNPLRTNREINELYHDADIDLSGFSNGEGWGLPAFNMTALGKTSIVTNCSSHVDWATKENAVLVDPIGKQPCYDNVHFFKGHQFNQGNFYLFTEEQLDKAMDSALERYKNGNVNGVTLQQKFTYSNTVEKLLEKLF